MKTVRHFHAFTLIELLIVIAIMGLLGTVSVGSYYGIKRGMEQRSVMQTVDEFVRAAYRRAVIDRVPTAVYFWNETIEDETQGDKLAVVGHAVAVRRSGRISLIQRNKYLIDEFGDLSADAYSDEEGEVDTSRVASSGDQGRYLYRVGDGTFHRSVVASSSALVSLNEVMMSRPDRKAVLEAYAYVLQDADGIDWKVGDPYGFEFAELTLPKNFIFGESYSQNALNPEQRIGNVMLFLNANDVKNATITVAGQKLDKSGDVSFEKIGTSEDPRSKRK